MLVHTGYQKLDITGKYASTTSLLTTGNVDLNANGVAIINVRAISSAAGSWSIDESGKIVIKTLCVGAVCIDDNAFKYLLEKNGINPSSGVINMESVLNTNSTSTDNSAVINSSTTEEIINSETSSTISQILESETNTDTSTSSSENQQIINIIEIPAADISSSTENL